MLVFKWINIVVILGYKCGVLIGKFVNEVERCAGWCNKVFY